VRQPRRKSRFVDLRSAEVIPPPVPRLFLGRLDEAALREELEQAGILAALVERGYPELSVHTEYQAGEHCLRVDAEGGGVSSLLELRLVEGATEGAEPTLRLCGVGGFSFLSIHWLSLQDPAHDFAAERPKLPGQRHPGLGLLQPLLDRLREWTRHWDLDALLFLPEYYHNAVFCAASFKFVDPVRQGRFLALQRDLKLVHVAQASAAVEQRRVIEEPWGAPLQWEPGEMVSPLREPLVRCLASREYETAVERARDAARFRLR
jgi:hypothetical protein